MSGQRIWAFGGILAFLLLMVLLELPLVSGVLRLGRKLECRLRLAFLHKIPRLGDRYFQSRLISDMAERSHSAHQVRQAGAPVPAVVVQGRGLIAALSDEGRATFRRF